MRRWLLLAALALVALLAATAALAGDKPKPTPKPKPSAESGQFGPFAVTTDETGSCGNVWANGTVERRFKVERADDGTFKLKEADHGTFKTVAGPSPGKCETKRKHGMAIRAGVTGKLDGSVAGTVSGGTFNENGCKAAGADCTTSAGLVTALFGSGATFSCATNSSDCKSHFEYSAPDQPGPRLLFHHFERKTHGAGTAAKTKFKGDIADA